MHFYCNVFLLFDYQKDVSLLFFVKYLLAQLFRIGFLKNRRLHVINLKDPKKISRNPEVLQMTLLLFFLQGSYCLFQSFLFL